MLSIGYLCDTGVQLSQFTPPQLFERRSKVVQAAERKFWVKVTPVSVSDASDM